ncbi:hypothetical protein SORBI_3002G008701 [Sorghum bicolor]|uniref:Uncharacterized protein n=1 Tax=Sorghum bicolor TaxID=4558 RepID=A0A1W0W1S1_SORBI|nr:hypothetical protein SORBI_3002G008701 [Sorghum bicolor]
MRAVGSLVRVPRHLHLRRRRRRVPPNYLRLAHHRVVHADSGPLGQQGPAHVHRRRLPRIPHALLEREPEHGHLLAGHRAEHGRHQAAHEPALLVLVHGHHLPPVLRRLVQAVTLAVVRQAQHVSPEARPAEPDAGVQEPPAAAPDAAVAADGARDVRDVGARGLAQRGERVHRRHSLRQERARRELGELRGLEPRGDDPILGDPVRVHVHQRAHGAHVGVPAADDHAVGAQQVPHGGALGEELRVGEDLERAVSGMRMQDPLHGLGGPDGDGGLLDDDLARAGAGRGGDHARRALPVGEVGRPAGAEAARLGGRVDGHEDDVGVGDMAVHVGAEGEVAAAAGPDDGVQARFQHREAVAVPGVDARPGDVHDGDLDGRALECHHGHGRAADVAGTNAADLHHGRLRIGSSKKMT